MRGLSIYSGLLSAAVLLGSVAPTSAQDRRGPSIPDRAAGIRGVERGLSKQREMRDYNDQIRDRQRKEDPVGRPKEPPLKRDIIERKPIS